MSKTKNTIRVMVVRWSPYLQFGKGENSVEIPRVIDGAFDIRPSDFDQRSGDATLVLPQELFEGRVVYAWIYGNAIATAVSRDMISGGKLHGRIRLVCKGGRATLFAEIVLDDKTPLPVHMRG